MKKLIFALLLFSFFAVGCGPMIGQVMVSGAGLKSFDVVSGPTPQVKRGTSILVFGPFDKTADAFYICRGEDAAKFSDEFIRLGLKSELYLGYGSAPQVKLADAKKMSPEELRSALGLATAPDYLLSGTLERRKMNVAPAQGVIMDEAYRLELLDLRTHSTSQYHAAVKDLAQKTIPDVAEALVQRLGVR